MDPDSIPRSYLIIVLMTILGGFFAATETAFSNCSRVRLMTWAEDGKKGADRALKILDKFDKAIITLLIGNNVAHVVATATAALLGIYYAGPALGPVLSTVILTLIIFIFSETIPKNIAKARSDGFVCAVSGFLSVLMFLFTPFDLLFMGLGSLLKKLFHAKNDDTAMTEDDFQSIIETIEDEGGLEAEESELIHSAVEFSDRNVMEVMTPRVQMVGLDIEDGPDKNEAKIMAERYTRLPVFQGDLDHIIGILNTKQYLHTRLTAPDHRADITAIMAPPYFITEEMGLHTLVDEMRRRKMHLAVIRDKWGGTYGMVTLDDLLEELVGEIREDEEVQA